MSRKGKDRGKPERSDVAPAGGGARDPAAGDDEHDALAAAVAEGDAGNTDAGTVADGDGGASTGDPSGDGAGDPVAEEMRDPNDAPAEEDGRQELEPNVKAAAFAAGFAYGVQTAAIDLNYAAPGHADPVDDVLRAAAAFMRQWPDAPLEAIPLHLRRQGFSGVPTAFRRERAAWRVFGTVLAELDRCDREEADEKAAAARRPDAGAGLPLEPALVPEPAPLTPTAFTSG